MRRISFIALFFTTLFTMQLMFSEKAVAEYPDKPISAIVAFAVGGGTDVKVRSITPYVEKYLNSQITVVNRPGSNGIIGFMGIAKAKPDGYTIGALNMPDVLINIHTKNADYRPEDFAIITSIGGSSHILGVKADSPFKTLKDIVEYAKANPKSLTVGTAGSLGNDELALLMFAQKAGIDVVRVPFTGSSTATTALLGGHIGALSFNFDEAVEFVKAGRIRVLGVMSEKRKPQLPDVPTYKEQGYDVVSSSYQIMAAPAKTPEPILKVLREAFRKALTNPELMATYEQRATEFEYIDPEKVKKELLDMNAGILETLKAAGIMK